LQAPVRDRSERELEIIERVRSICATLPEVDERVDGFGHAAFSVGSKSFVLIGAGKGEGSLSFKSDAITQSRLAQTGPYVRTPGLGHHGWVTLWGDSKINWEDMRDLIADAYRLVAPRRILRGMASPTDTDP
jgi:predicted DNA-binding protein (MmcQ/YjbR family)